MFLGIEIGGTKLQLGVGAGDGSPLVELVRQDIDPGEGASGILRQIEAAAGALVRRHQVQAIGCGFGGPVDSSRGRTIKSHQIDGWDDFPLAHWFRERLGFPVAISNDCDVGGLAEARFGAGKGSRVMFYVTVGTGIGGGLILDGDIYHGAGSAAAEIGHLRPGLESLDPDQTVESIASGWGVAAAAKARLSHVERLTAFDVAQAAVHGDAAAVEVLQRGVQTLGWAIAQVITLLSPEIVVVGGGLSLIGDPWFLDPLRGHVARYVFPPLAGSYRIERAQLGEEVVVHGALALAQQTA